MGLGEGIGNFIGGTVKNVGGFFVDAGKAIGAQTTELAEKCDGRKANEVNFRESAGGYSTILNIGGAIGGALGGWKLGEKFGTVGKVVGGVGLAVIGSKLGSMVQEVGSDVAAAQDYSREAEKKGAKGNFGKALWGNLTNFKGQSYDGAIGSEQTAEADGPDI